jgi:hypothetical protein
MSIIVSLNEYDSTSIIKWVWLRLIIRIYHRLRRTVSKSQLRCIPGRIIKLSIMDLMSTLHKISIMTRRWESSNHKHPWASTGGRQWPHGWAGLPAKHVAISWDYIPAQDFCTRRWGGPYHSTHHYIISSRWNDKCPPRCPGDGSATSVIGSSIAHLSLNL